MCVPRRFFPPIYLNGFIGRSRMFFIWRCHDGGRAMALGWQIRTGFLGEIGRLGWIYNCCIRLVLLRRRILPFFLSHDVWTKVDQPAGTGFSYTSTDRYVHTIDIVDASTFPRRVIRTKPIYFFRLSNSCSNLWRTFMTFFQNTRLWMCVFPCLLSVSYSIHL